MINNLRISIKATTYGPCWLSIDDNFSQCVARVELHFPIVDFADEVIPSLPFLKLCFLISHSNTSAISTEFSDTILYLNVFSWK